MAPTVKDILKQTGMTDETITALDANVLKAFESVLTTATSSQEDAAEKLRLQQDLYDREIAPALNAWGSEKATLEAERDFYKKQNEGARTGGFIPKDAPVHVAPTQDPGTGRFVPAGNPVPGSPSFDPGKVITAVSNAQWAGNEYARLFGGPMPDDFESLLKEATDNRMDFKPWVERKYKFGEKRTEIAAVKQKEHDDKIRSEQKAASDKEWAERVGNNPMVRQGVPSQYDQINAGVKAGQLKDPLTLSPEARRSQTRQNIAAEMNSQGTA